jgi:very-short-patch-repair endonuclease
MVNLGKAIKKDMYFGAKPELFRLALRMRRNATPGEEAMWKLLRKFRKEGLVFRRQHPIDFFIADFYCHRLRLVIEVDGDYHLDDDALVYDDQRSGELERFGITVMRFPNEDIQKTPDYIVSSIYLKIAELASPSPPGEGDGRG